MLRSGAKGRGVAMSNEGKAKNMMVEARDTLRRAAEEIRSLRSENERLRDYRNHTERMLALFEGGPRFADVGGEGIDVAWEAESLALTLDEGCR